MMYAEVVDRNIKDKAVMENLVMMKVVLPGI